MAKYGLDRYGLSYYGIGYESRFAGSITAVPVGYGAISVKFVAPAKRETPSSTTDLWTDLVLVRNSVGYPVDPDDGDMLLYNTTGANLDGPDTGLVEGITYYYTLFVKDAALNLWRRAGDASAISVKDFGTLGIMWSSLAASLQSASRSEVGGADENEDLLNFLKLLAFEYDLEKTQTYMMMPALNPSRISHHFLPALAQELGTVFEPALGYQRIRSILVNAIEVYRSAGTIDGLKLFIKSLSGYDTLISSGKNLLIDYNSSSFEENEGLWSATNATLSSVPTGVIPPYAEPTAPAEFPNRQLGSLEVLSAGSGYVTLTCGSFADAKAIPVKEGVDYSFSVYSTAATVGRSITLSIEWYTMFGTSLGTSAGTPVSNSLVNWDTRPSVSAVAPTGAAFAVPSIDIASVGASEVHYFDAAQFEASATPTSFEDARTIEITLLANRINELLNPSFEVAQAPWTVTNAADVEVVTSTGGHPHHVVSGYALEVYPATTSNVTVSSEHITGGTLGLAIGSSYSFSASVQLASYGGTPTTDMTWVAIEWYDSSDVLIGTATGTPLAATLSTWARPSVTATVPDNTAYAIAKIYWTPSVTTLSMLVDTALFEKNAFVDSFFDGTSGFASVSDLLWEDTVDYSRSHYYKNKAFVYARLLDLLPDYLPLNSTYVVKFAQP